MTPKSSATGSSQQPGTTAAARTVDEYIAAFPSSVQKLLRQVRKTIRAAAPGAEEAISYGIPAYRLHGILIYFAGFKKHISVYPAPRGAAAFRDELATYKGGKGTVQFPLDQPIPHDLITRIVEFRIADNLERAEKKKRKR